jgi:hypothetical protein
VPVSFQDDAGPMAAVTVRERRLTKTAELVLHQILSTGSQVSARE